jgi:hypothetical protein
MAYHDTDRVDVVSLGEQAAEAIRSLNHLTRGPGAFADPTQACQLVAALTAMTGRLPQLLGQTATWLHGELHTGRLRIDTTAHTDDPAELLAAIAACLAQAGHCAHRLNQVLDTTQQHTAHLATAP